MANFRGIVLYNIERDGNLNGVYTNNHRDTNGRIATETARLRDNTLIKGGTEEHVYDCFYFDTFENGIECTLIFRITNGIYNAEWRSNDTNDIIFLGEGFLMNDRQIAISYWTKN